MMRLLRAKVAIPVRVATHKKGINNFMRDNPIALMAINSGGIAAEFVQGVEGGQ